MGDAEPDADGEGEVLHVQVALGLGDAEPGEEEVMYLLVLYSTIAVYQ